MTDTFPYDTIKIDVRGPVAYLRFDRVERRNTVTAHMVEEVHAALETLAARDDLSVVVLTGNGPTFCPGADLHREHGQPASIPTRESYLSGALLVEMPQITVAAINGGCAGAGFAWASACDLRVAASTAKIAVAFLEVGVSGEMGAGWTLTRMLGSARARELYLLPSKITADVALDIGLVSRVFPTETFADDVDALVTELSLRDPVALRLIKANLVDAEHLGLRDYIAVETERHRSRFEGEAAAGTLSRFSERARDLSSDTR
ncbi:enoyl-CoA hydratase/isomerase family protein [Aeromicrobium ginsengisoli]|uniref:Enoyl-CoA hydratase/isomerase family protein n=1 Tax=Aeromicrobium ginsengisoli TaxID=363867 RepID=A0A5M4F971_9ACTN|nr:enoyl-CoA hydratase/isomerase family protein [Aeromicrobium ginsengisoli]KAA1394258.1 enoyl-CoA hydratase/isomerase family protein [Aeromicrobium ginsengisoli]